MTVTLTEAQRAAAVLLLCGTPGGDGGAVVLDLPPGAVLDQSGTPTVVLKQAEEEAPVQDSSTSCGLEDTGQEVGAMLPSHAVLPVMSSPFRQALWMP